MRANDPYFTDRDGNTAYCYPTTLEEGEQTGDPYDDEPTVYYLLVDRTRVTFTPSELRQFAVDLIGLVARDENRV